MLKRDISVLVLLVIAVKRLNLLLKNTFFCQINFRSSISLQGIVSISCNASNA